MKSVVLLSAGLDSTVNLFEAKAAGSVVLALTFDYGQRAAKKEVFAAKQICEKVGVPHKVVRLDFFQDFGQSSLVDQSLKLPLSSDISITDQKISEKTAQAVWVPNRNGIFLNIAAGFAEALKAECVIPGFNLEEAATFPDNSEKFLNQLTKSFSFSTANQIQAHCYTTHLNKIEIVKRGLELRVDFNHIWPCYQAENQWCGQCESCLRAKRAFHANNLEFPPR